MAKKSKALKKEKEVKNHPDPHIDQDFPGFPHAPSHKKILNLKAGKKRK